ncbi:hypothetical protein B0H94_11524 [Salsuginibacillus halophilus]|uniref:Uncharacterized protein n=1 Tax=Salsuginibacillus halophilus TaxID=517424 RepID=A0A2P8H8A9_9BACI|nr:hypothetical protein [Salsuginibacillus halophilus]PSL42420.1 hypothetical protein B0H94_11524 [Salsuginibacillus halophilus]
MAEILVIYYGFYPLAAVFFGTFAGLNAAAKDMKRVFVYAGLFLLIYLPGAFYVPLGGMEPDFLFTVTLIYILLFSVGLGTGWFARRNG